MLFKWRALSSYLLRPDVRRDRNYRKLLPGLPAIVAATSAVIVGFLAWQHSEEQVASRYLDQARACYKAKNYTEALTCYERLVHMEEGRQASLFGLARTLEALGQEERAVLLMRELAPPDRAGHGDAHWWWARRLLATPDLGAGARTLEHHLVSALDGGAADVDAVRGVLGEMYLAEGKLKQAEALLQPASKVHPQLRLRLAQLYALRGEPDAARAEARAMLAHFRALALSEPREHQPRLYWADAALFLEDFSGAEAALQDGLKASGAALYRTALARVYLAWSDALGRARQANPAEQLNLVQKALEQDPGYADALLRLWAFTQASGDAATNARNTLRTLLASGRGGALAHLALGMDAWQQGDEAAGLVHLEQAYVAAPGIALVANNLAWALAAAQPPDLPRALALIDSVVQRFPAEPTYRDTRAQILGRLGRWREALADYQAALPAHATRADFHRRLADCYRHLNMPAMAAEHDRLSQSSSLPR